MSPSQPEASPSRWRRQTSRTEGETSPVGGIAGDAQPWASPDRLDLAGPLTLEELHGLGELRTRMCDGGAAPWRGSVTAELLDVVVHLSPPEPERTGASESAPTRSWRDRHRYGLCYYRHGPDYLAVKDMRSPDDRSSFVIDDPATVDVFLRCLVATARGSLTVEETEIAESLVDERLLLSGDGHYLTLPYRMRRWPVPYDAI